MEKKENKEQLTEILVLENRSSTSIDNIIIRHMMRELGSVPGVHAYAVYSLLKSFSNERLPIITLKDWADYIGMTMPSFNNALHDLATLKMIHIERGSRGITKYVLYNFNYPVDIEKIKGNKLCSFDQTIPLLNIKTYDEIQQEIPEQTEQEIQQIEDATLQENCEVVVNIKKKKRKKPCKEAIIQRYQATAQKIMDAVHTVKKTQKNIISYSDCESLYKLHILDDYDLIQIKQVVDWYVKNIGGTYVPVAHSIDSFRRKYESLLAGMKRDAIKPKKIVIDPSLIASNNKYDTIKTNMTKIDDIHSMYTEEDDYGY